MRPTQFSADTIIALLRKQTVASLPDVLVALGPRVSRRTAFRKLKDLDARTSYSHRGGYYTLDELISDAASGRSPASASPAPAPSSQRPRRSSSTPRPDTSSTSWIHVGTQDGCEARRRRG